MYIAEKCKFCCKNPCECSMPRADDSQRVMPGYAENFQEDYGQVTVLIDEDRDSRCAYAVCSMYKDERSGKPRILQFGQDTTDEVVEFALAMIKKHDAKVVCDAIPGGELQAIARHFRWTVSRPRNDEFPAIGFICGLGR